MTTLVIDRSTDVQSAALVKDGAIAASCILEDADARSGDWVTRIRDFLAANGESVATLGRIVAGTGPGSFAGIRSALAFAQGCAAGAGCEVLGLTSAAAYSKHEGPVAVIGDARRGLFWIALFDGPQLAVPVFQVKREELKLRVPLSADVVSPDAKRIGAVLSEEFEERFRDCGAPLAEGLARAMLANEKLLVKEPLPIYLNPAVRQD